jgi:hypothetical protein
MSNNTNTTNTNNTAIHPHGNAAQLCLQLSLPAGP